MPSVVPLFLTEQLRVTLESGFTVIWLEYWQSRDEEQGAALISQPRLLADEASATKKKVKLFQTFHDL